MNQNRLIAFALLLGAVTAAPLAAHADVMASSVSGSGDSSFRPLRLFQKLGPGDVVRCDSDGEATLTQVGGGARFRVPSGGTATVTADGVTGAQKSSALKGPGPHVFGSMGSARLSGIVGRPGVAPRPILADRAVFNGYYVRKEGDTSPLVFRWDSEQDPGADKQVATYGFTLFDRYGNVLFHSRAAGREAAYPADLPPPSLKQPYVWRIVPYSKSGKMIANAGSRWGVVTLLSPEDAGALETQAKEVLAQADPKDTSALVTLAYVYFDYGVYQRVLELLGDTSLSIQDKAGNAVPRPGVLEMQEKVFGELGPAAVQFAYPFDPEKSPAAAAAAAATKP
jgi:hypothetical protein